MSSSRCHIFFKSALIISIVSVSMLCSAQKGLEVGLRGGIAHYFGDLNPSYTLSDPGLHLGMKFRRNFNERICVSMGLDYGRLSGSDSNSFNSFEKNRNLDFSSNVIDASFTMEFNFFPYIHGSADYNYTPYLFGGFSLVRFNPKTEYQGETYILRDYNTEGADYGLTSGAFAYGMGMKWDINRDFSINVEISGRRLFSDYIDDVSQNYPSRTPNNAIAAALSNRSEDTDFGAPGTQRGDGLSNDSVYFLSVGVMRYFGKLPCPAISRDIF